MTTMTEAQRREYQKGVDMVKAVAAKLAKREAASRRRKRNAKNNATHRVHIGYTATGRNRWRYFPMFSEAVAACEAVFQQTGIVLSIEALPEVVTTTYHALPHGGNAPEPNWPDRD